MERFAANGSGYIGRGCRSGCRDKIPDEMFDKVFAVGEGVGVPALQQVHRAMGVDVDQHGAVDMSPYEREILDAHSGYPPEVRIGQCRLQAHKRGAARACSVIHRSQRAMAAMVSSAWQ